MCEETAIDGIAARQTPKERERSVVAVRLALGVAFAGVVAWCGTVVHLRPDLVGDEKCHVPAIQALLRGDWTLAQGLPMPPAYHWLASWATRWADGQLWALRAFQALLTVAAIALYHTAARVFRPSYGAHDLLRFAWNPLLISFWAFVYTDVAALVGVLLALNFHLRKRFVPAALGLAVACAVRQSSVIWGAFFVAWSCADAWPPVGRPRRATLLAWFRQVLRQTGTGVRAYLLVVAGGGALLLIGRGRLFAEAMANDPSPNPAQFYLAALTAALLWVPVWLPWLAQMWPRRFVPGLMRPSRAALAAAAVGVLATIFRNPHPWNMNLDYLRNWLLYAMTTYGWTCAPLAALIVVFVSVYTLAAARSPARRVLVLTWVFAGLYLFPHPVADPRYCIVPFVLVDFFTPYTLAEARRLTFWYLLLTVGIAAVLVCQPGGVRGVI